jgi:hypothetical protein
MSLPPLEVIGKDEANRRRENFRRTIEKRASELEATKSAPAVLAAPIVKPAAPPIIYPVVYPAEPVHVEHARVEAPREPAPPKIVDIQRVVCRFYGVSLAEMLSPRRAARIVRPRQIAMYLAKILTSKSFPEIGRRFGGRDHTTVLHANRKIERLLVSDVETAEQIAALKLLIEAPAQ